MPLSSLNLELAAGGVIFWVHEGDFGETADVNRYMSDLPDLQALLRKVSLVGSRTSSPGCG